MTDAAAPRRPVPLTARLSLLGVAMFLVGTNGFVIAGLLPDIAAGLGTTRAGVGLSISVYAGIVAVLAPAVATVLPRVPRTWLMTIGMLVVGAGTALTAIATGLPLFIAGRALAAIGAAAVVPTAVAAASALAPPERRGRALGLVMLGFTLSTAAGSPLGTFVAHYGGWRLPLAAVAVLAVASAASIALLVRDVPLSPPLPLARRLAVLGEPRILLTLLSAVFTVGGFNTAYIYSSTYTVEATGGSGALLAGLLLAYGVGGVLGNLVASRFTDRFGNRSVASLFMASHVVALAIMPFAEPSYVVLAVVFLVWGVAAFGTTIPVQHRLVTIDPQRGAMSVAWYSTALYLGITLAPLFGGAALEVAGAAEVPRAAALSVLVAAVLFQAGYLVRRSARD